MPELLLALNRERAQKPFTFKTTGINVYSFEEALYHCYMYWKESADDFSSLQFAAWVAEELGLYYIASKIKSLSGYESFTEKFLKFLLITDYFSEEQLTDIRGEMKAWENALEWERLKERADALNFKGDAVNAYPLYERALSFGENAALLNNFAVCVMKLGRYDEAFSYLNRAYEKPPEEISFDILLNLTEAAIYSHDFNKAVELLKKISETGDTANVCFLNAELCYEAGDIRSAAAYLEKSAGENLDPYCIYRLSEIYAELRMYEKALDILGRITGPDKEFLMKQAEVYIAMEHVPAAIKCIEKALLTNRADSELWIRLAYYYRLNYDSQKAGAAIITALNYSPGNEQALLEQARIKKSMGKTREYQDVLKNILSSLKKKYRERLT